MNEPTAVSLTLAAAELLYSDNRGAFAATAGPRQENPRVCGGRNSTVRRQQSLERVIYFSRFYITPDILQQGNFTEPKNSFSIL